MEAVKKPGRPILDPSKKRTAEYRYRMTETEYAVLFDASKKSGYPVSEIIREALSDWYRKAGVK
ncbi:MAG: hypothetical protein J6T99_06170 [Oscillospiraceae bacterium]|nr:hypothetical protein [Oscillospiraceae bacterium]